MEKNKVLTSDELDNALYELEKQGYYKKNQGNPS